MASHTMTAAVQSAGPVGRDDPGHANRADRLIRESIRAMSTGDLIEYVSEMDDGGAETGYRLWVFEVAAAELAGRFGLPRDGE